MNVNVIVIGIGKLGAGIAKELSSKGESVLAIDRSKEAMERLEGYMGFEQIGDALDLSFLEANGIKTAKSVIIVTENDSTNLFLADICFRIYGIPRIFIRLNDARKEKLCEGTNVQCICPFFLSMERFDRLYNH